MIPRGKLDITYQDILKGIYYCFRSFSNPGEAPEQTGNKGKLICLSVRTGFDLVLKALNFPAGTEILVTDINIQDMFTIITEHQLDAIPLPVDRHSLQLSPAQLEAAITPFTKAILITHLFGSIMETAEILAIAKRHHLVVIEDCAQAFVGDDYQGNPLTDIVLYSFGLIKTNTAISGAMLQINDPVRYHQVRILNQQLPEQPVSVFRRKLWKSFLIKLLTTKIIYTLFYNYCMKTGKDFDQVLSGFTRGFPRSELLQKIRYRHCLPNQYLLERRLADFKPASIDERRKLAFDILGHIPEKMKTGNFNKAHSYWVLPVHTENPGALIDLLRTNGFDATQKASSLVRYSSLRSSSPAADQLLLEKLVYLPADTGMSRLNRIKLASLLNE